MLPELKPDIVKIADLVNRLAGIQLGEKSYAMIEARITKRLHELGLTSVKDYLRLVEEHPDREYPRLISLLTTHHSFFFREFGHFEFLERALPELVRSARARGQKKLRVWSAACSRGQEVYSLAMFLSTHLRAIAPDFDFEILGTDICAESVATAKNGVYLRDEIKDVPMSYVGSHWARGTGEISKFVRAQASLRRGCRFEELNLVDFKPEAVGLFDVIFCRNVFIYFSRADIQATTRKLLKCMYPEGILVLGISESLSGLDLNCRSIGTSVYAHAQAAQAVPVSKPPAKIRVFCVDDSPSIQAVLKKIFTHSEFEVVGTAQNGLEAAHRLAEVQADVVTLDLHMPEQDGIAYLENSFSKTHPPVLIVSSVAREEKSLALRALELGAGDYVEKPTLANLVSVAEEIRMKVKCLVRPQSTAKVLHLDKAFSRKSPGGPASGDSRLVVAGPDSTDLISMLGRMQGVKDRPLVFWIHGVTDQKKFLAKLAQGSSRHKTFAEGIEGLANGQSLILFNGEIDLLAKNKNFTFARLAVLIARGCPAEALKRIDSMSPSYVQLEEGVVLKPRRVDRVLPATSFFYHSETELKKESA